MREKFIEITRDTIKIAVCLILVFSIIVGFFVVINAGIEQAITDLNTSVKEEKIKGQKICESFCETHEGFHHVILNLFSSSCVCKDGTQVDY